MYSKEYEKKEKVSFFLKTADGYSFVLVLISPSRSK